MQPMQLKVGEIVKQLNARLRAGDPHHLLSSFSTDTRTLSSGQLFIALRGERFDAHEFIAEALRKGAAGVLAEYLPRGVSFPKDKLFIQVSDTLHALGELARLWRSNTSAFVVTVAGSSGKTTTKEFLAHFLAPYQPLLASYKNWNNLVGVPLNLLRLEGHHQFAVVEIAMNQKGELERLVQICQPEMLLITNIGVAHIGNFGSLHKLLAAKAELFTHLPSWSQIIYNGDCPLTAHLLSRVPQFQNRVSFGLREGNDVYAREIKPLSPLGYEFTVVFTNGGTSLSEKKLSRTLPVRLPLFGRHNVLNVLAALTAVYALNLSTDEMLTSLEEFEAPEMRSCCEVINQITFIEDSYNANPESMKKALLSYNDVPSTGKRYLCLADMMELGVFSSRYHGLVGKFLGQINFDCLLTLGEQARLIAEEAQCLKKEIHVMSCPDEVVSTLVPRLRAGDLIMFKGSRQMHLERVARGVKDGLSLTAV